MQLTICLDHYLPEKNCKMIIKFMIIGYLCSSSNKHSAENIKITFITENNAIDNIKMYHRYIIDIMTWISIADKYSCNHCGKTLKLYLYMTSLRKTLVI